MRIVLLKSVTGSECSECKNDFEYDPTRHIIEKQRKHHLSKREDPVLCDECYEEGKVFVQEDHERNKTWKLMCVV